MIIDIVHALTTEGVNPVSAIKNKRNMAVISFILRLETFIVFRQLVNPIITKPGVSARYSQNMINATIFEVLYSFI